MKIVQLLLFLLPVDGSYQCVCGWGGGGFELGRWYDNTDGVTKWIRVSCFVRAAAY